MAKQKTEFVGRVSITMNHLFEAVGVLDVEKKFPESFSFLTFIPGIKDDTKASGRSYEVKKRESIKFQIEELYQLSAALEDAAKTGACTFNKFADTSKSDYVQGTPIKKTVGVGVSGDKIFLNYSGVGKVGLSLNKYQALALSKQLENLANTTEQMLFTSQREKALVYSASQQEAFQQQPQPQQQHYQQQPYYSQPQQPYYQS